MDVDKFVEEFFQATESPGHMVALMVQFQEASTGVQAEIMEKIRRREEYQGRCDLVSGRSSLKCRGIRPHG